MLTEIDRTIMNQLNHNLDTDVEDTIAIQAILNQNQGLLFQLSMINMQDLPVTDKLLIQKIINKYQYIIATIDIRKREIQTKISATNTGKTMMSAYMRYDTQASFVNRDL